MALSHKHVLMDVAMQIMRANDVTVDEFRAVDHDIAAGVYPDMTEHGASSDEWPTLFDRVMAADILVIGSPIWLGQTSSVCQRFIERLFRQLRHVERRRAVRLLRTGRRLHHHG